jgi:hypothetical protein
MNFSAARIDSGAATFSANINHNGASARAAEKNNFAEFHPSQSVSRVFALCIV